MEKKKPAEAKPAPRRRRPHPLGMAVASVVRPMVGKKGFADVEIITRWAEIAGAEVAAHSLPLRIAKARSGVADGATLHVRVASSAFALVLKHQEPELCDRVNRYFGYPAVTRLKIAVGSLPPPPEPPPPPAPPIPLSAEEEAAVARVGDADLRAALAALGQSIHRRARDGG